MRYRILVSMAAIALLTVGCVRQHNFEVVDETYVHKYGVAVPPDYWNSSGQHGAIISKLADGVTVSRSYESGILDGETTFTFPHSDKCQKKQIYAKNKLVKEIDYFLDGSPRQEISYDLPTSSREVTTWYTTGSPKSHEKYEGEILFSGEYYNTSNQRDSFVDNYEGARVNRDDYGQIICRDLIQEGTKILTTTYHPNGAPLEQIPYKNGVIEGYKKTFYPGGEPNTVEHWSKGSQNGITTVYQNGEKYADVSYVNGRKNGVERRYKDGTIVVEEVYWENDRQHGPMNTYVGDSVKTDWYFQGQPTSRVNYEILMNHPNIR